MADAGRGLPSPPPPGLLFVENVRDYFSLITLSAAEQFEAAAEAARRGLGSGKVYDLLARSATFS